MTKSPSPSIPLQIAAFTFIRWVLNISNRMVYPFLRAFARGLGVSEMAVSAAISGRSLLGALSPFLALIGDRRGRKTGMLLGLGLFIAGVSLVFLWPSYLTFFAALSLAYLGFFTFGSSMQAYLGDAIPYAQRGRALAFAEMGWSLSFVLGMPLVGLLIDRLGWSSPFPFLAGLGLVSIAIIARVVPKSSPPVTTTGSVQNLKQVFTSSNALAGLMFTLCMVAANEVINVVFGVFMEDTFQLKIAGLGTAAMVIGFAELGGEIFTASWVDRIGKPRVVRIGVLACSAIALVVPLLGASLWAVLAVLFLSYLCFEVTFISSLAIISEILPASRSTMMGANVAAISLGRGLGALLAPLIYQWGFQANTLVALGFSILALAALSRIRIACLAPT
jgi:predicted MFS family arabinose efflux permease